jgi:hypothetical protein
MTRINNSKSSSYYLAALSFATLVLFSSGSQAEQPENLLSYPSANLIEPRPLSSEQRSVLGKLFEQSLSADVLAKRSSELCTKPILNSSPDNDFTKKSVTKTETSLITEVIFQRDSGKVGIELESFSVLVQFERQRVVLRHLSPRFQNDAGGFRVPMAPSSTRAVRLEGRLGADVVAFVPPLSDCSQRAVALCPRQFTKNDELLRSPYSAKDVRPIFSLKADGVLAAPTGSAGKIVTSLLASAGVSIPGEWSKSATGPGTISQEIQFSVQDDERRISQPALPLSSAPFNFAAESRVDLGQPERPLRRTSERIDVEISTVKVGDFYDLELGTSELSVEGGDCALVVESGEEVV